MPDVHVVPAGDKWACEINGNTRSTHDTQAVATPPYPQTMQRTALRTQRSTCAVEWRETLALLLARAARVIAQQTGPVESAVCNSIDRTTARSTCSGLRYRIAPLPMLRSSS